MRQTKNTDPTGFIADREMIEMMIQDSPVGMYMMEKDDRFSYVNKSFCQLTGYGKEELTSGAVRIQDILHPEDLSFVLESMRNRKEGKEAEDRYRVRGIKKDGTVTHVEIQAKRAIVTGNKIIFGTVIDVTEEVTAGLQHKETKERFQSLFYNNPDAIFSFDMDGKFIDANPGCEELTGHSFEELKEMSFAPFIVSEDLPIALHYFEQAISGKANTYDLTIARKDGKRRLLNVTNFPMEAKGKIIGAYGIAKDVTEKMEYHKQIEDLAFYDLLTKLPNRKLFEDRLQQVIELSKDTKRTTAVLFLDLDRFKFINDSLGHHTGDEFLKSVAGRLQENLRKTDTIGRFAGDEFAILLPDITKKEAIQLAERLNESIAEPFQVDGHSISVSASIGIALTNDRCQQAGNLIKKADRAMYHTKKYGKNNYTFYSKELDQETHYKLAIERDLKVAVCNQELVLHYQPIVDLKSGTCNAMEVLIRWNHPRFGLVSPDDFIPISEESGQIVSIGKWVLRTACAQNKKWQEEGHPSFKVAVNISGVQLQHQGFVQMVEDILEETGLEPKWLELELTESILMEDTELLKESLKKLKALGVSMSIDDFGTGYTSLSYLRQYSFDRVKIDRVFIEDIPNDLNGKAITSTIVSLAHKLKMGVIAEGIEDETQLSYLRKERCDEGQGFYFSRPLPAEMHQFGNPIDK